MGTAAAECCEERPGDGASPGACATDQITPERPEERRPAARQDGSVEPAKIKFERSERTVVSAFGQGGWYRGRRLSAGSSLRQSFIADAGGHPDGRVRWDFRGDDPPKPPRKWRGA